MRSHGAPAAGADGNPLAARLLRIVGVLLMLTALGVGLSHAPDRPVQTLVARWAPPPSDFIDVKGQVVHIRDEGPRNDPLPIVLMHGTASSLHTWEGWVRGLKAQRRVITFDLPGFGLTGPFAGQYPPDDYSGDAEARFVLDLLDAMHVQRAVLGGNSFGGEVAWRTAWLAPQRVARLVLVDAAGLPFKAPFAPLGLALARVPVLSHLMDWLLPRPLVAQSVAAAYGNPRRITPELIDRYFELLLREGNRRALRLRLQQATPGADAARIATLKLPTLIIWGGRDQLPPAVGRRFQAQIAGSQLVVLDALGHVPQEEDPDASVAPVLAFLAQAASLPPH